jgi:aspartate/methionine/tyrosine aminotransferase
MGTRGMKTAERMRLVKPSGTIAMAEKAREVERSGRKVYHLEVGDPDFETPEHIKKAAYEAIEKGFTHYTSSKGIFELREAVSKSLETRGIQANPEKEILVTPGAKHAIYCACLATLNPGDEVLVLAPTWPTHFQCVEITEARAVEVPCGDSYSIDEEDLKKKITDKSKMILVSSPNNPTGGILGEKDLKIVADLIVDHDLFVLSDEIYDQIVYDGSTTVSIASFENARERTIFVNGFSKTYAMTGWRLGYTFANEEVTRAMTRVQQSTTTCATSFVQKAGIAALTGPQDCISKMVEEYDRRRKFIVKQLNKNPDLSCVMPKGAFYVFPDVSCLKMPSFEVCRRMLEEEGISSTPGSVFGVSGEGHIRLSYATSLETISEALRKIKEFANRHTGS